MKKIIYLLILLFAISSCTKEVKIDIPGFEEQLMIDGSIETNFPPVVLLSRSKDIYSPTNIDAWSHSESWRRNKRSCIRRNLHR